MQFLVLYRRRVDQIEFPGMAVALKSEVIRLRELYAAEKIRLIWSRHDIPGCCFVIDCVDPDEAHALVVSLPLAEAGMVESMIVPIGSYDGFSSVDIKWPWTDREVELALRKQLKSQT